MKTYQDLLEIGENEKDRMNFCVSAISEYKASPEYKIAVDADLYFQGENVTITMVDKWITDVFGQKKRDLWSPNHKIKSHLYPCFIIQQVLFLLGNGISFNEESTQKKLGKNFYKRMLHAAFNALNGGKTFIFWNQDHIIEFPATQYLPLVDEETGMYAAGIRFWQLTPDKPLRVVLFEPDGYTAYIKNKGEDITLYEAKRPYRLNVTVSDTGTEIAPGEPYPGFPVIPLENFGGKSALLGNRETVDAYDLMISKLVNNLDNAEFVYWVIKNAPGMEEEDLQAFLQHLKTSGIIATGEGQEVDAHQIEAPFEATEAALATLRKQLFTDFMAVDTESIAGGADTATRIIATYEPLNEKTDLFEAQVTECIEGILEVAGIDDVPTYTRAMVVNQQEQIRTLVEAAEYLDSEYILRKILEILGDADKTDEILERKLAADASRFEDESNNIVYTETEVE